MPRLRVKRLIVCGVVGVVATVLSAWALTCRAQSMWFFRPSSWSSSGPQAGLQFEWQTDVPALWPRANKTWRFHWIGFRQTETRYSESRVSGRTVYWDQNIHTELCRYSGWPMEALKSRTLLGPGLPWPYGDGLRVASGAAKQGSFVLPLRPVWPGFAVNAAFYAGMCWVLLAAPGVVRRWRRRRRGACAACGYDLAGLEACPECGAPS